MQSNPQQQAAPRPFLETLRELRNGVTIEELGDEMAKLVAAVRSTNKAGKLVLTLSIRPATKGDATTVTLEDGIVTKLPVPDRRATIMFTTEQNGLSRKDPNQQELKLREVSGGDKTEPLRDVG